MGRRAYWVAGGLAAAAVVVGLALLWAVLNLNALIARDQGAILRRVSAALGRPVSAGRIEAHLGWGASIEIEGLKVADDPAFSQLPFVAAQQMYLDLELAPLLHGKVKLLRFRLLEPQVQIVRNQAGGLNLDSLGAASAKASGAAPAPLAASSASSSSGPEALAALAVTEFDIVDGTILYKDAASKTAPLAINHFNAQITDLGLRHPFQAAIQLALLGQDQNFTVDGTVGPLLQGGRIEAGAIPLKLTFKAGPLVLDRVAEIGGGLMPVGLSMPDPLTVNGQLNGPIGALYVALDTVLDSYHVAYRSGANGAPTTLVLAGQAGVDGDLKPLDTHREYKVTVRLAGLNVKIAGPLTTTLANLNGKVDLTPTRATIEPTKFGLGPGQAELQGQMASLSPLQGSLSLKADKLRLADLLAGHSPADEVDQLALDADLSGASSAPLLKAKLASSAGELNDLAYRNLAATLGYDGTRITASPLKAEVFAGSLAVNGSFLPGTRPRFDMTANGAHLDLDQMMQWGGVTSRSLKGFLTANVHATGAGSSWAAIEPRLAGAGRLSVSNGALIGINIVALTINKIAAAPGVSQLVNATFMSSHHGLLSDPNTELNQASMTFTLAGDRITTHDLTVQSSDYGITGDGWFDLDKNISMNSDIRLTFGLSVALPVMIAGRYPALLVLPNLPKLAERVASGALSVPGAILNKGASSLGGVVGGLKSWLP